MNTIPRLSRPVNHRRQ